MNEWIKHSQKSTFFEYRLRDCRLCMEMYPCHCSGVSVIPVFELGVFGGKTSRLPRSSSFAVCIDWTYYLSRVQTLTGQRSPAMYGRTVWNSPSAALHNNSLSLNTFGRCIADNIFWTMITPSGATVASFCDSTCRDVTKCDCIGAWQPCCGAMFIIMHCKSETKLRIAGFWLTAIYWQI